MSTAIAFSGSTAETILVPLPANVRVKIVVRYLDGSVFQNPSLHGWHAEAETGGITGGSVTHRDRRRSILDAIDRLVNRLVDEGDRSPNRRKPIKAVINALTAWQAQFAKEQSMSTRTILSGKQCRELLEDFRRSYAAFEHSFVELGEQAATIREQEAYGEKCETFDAWIRSERYARSVVYDAMKAARFYRLTAPVAEPLKIVLDRESHFRKFPAEATAKQATAVVQELKAIVEPDADGTRHPTAKQVDAAVAKVFPEKRREEEASSLKPEASSLKPEASSLKSQASPLPPRIAPDTITGVVVDVQPEIGADSILRPVNAADRLAAVRETIEVLSRNYDVAFQKALATLLYDLCFEIRDRISPLKPHASRRAK